MVTGHYGFALGMKGRERLVPLWAVILAAFWLDVLFLPLLATGIETLDDAPGTDGGYGEVVIHADYTHSLVGAVAISFVTGWLVTRWWGRRGGIAIGAVVFSHWVLDLVVHRHDMPLLPGNLGDVRVGFGLWEVEWAAVLTEGAILLVGAYLYWRGARAAGTPVRRANLLAGGLLLLGAVVLGIDAARV
jgi:hypothetical protein